MPKGNKYPLATTANKVLNREFFIYLNTLGYSQSTLQSIPSYTREFLHRQEQKYKAVAETTQQDIEEHHQYLQTRPSQTKPGALSGMMIASHLFGIKLFFGWMEATGCISSNPISGLNFPWPAYNQRTVLTREEITRLYKATETLRDKAMLGLFYGCGLRRSEGEALNTADIKLSEKLLIVREGKGLKRRVVPLAEQVKTDFENYYYNERSDYLNHLSGKSETAFMINNKGRRMTRDSYNPRLKYLVKRAGINPGVCLHQLRHSIATHLLEQGMSIEKVRDFLGHKYIDTTQKYTHVNQLKLF